MSYIYYIYIIYFIYLCFQYDTDYLISKTAYYLQCNMEVYQLCIYIVHRKYEYNVVLFVKLIHLFFAVDVTTAHLRMIQATVMSHLQKWWQVTWTKRLSVCHIIAWIVPNYKMTYKLWNMCISYLFPWFQLLLRNLIDKSTHYVLQQLWF